MGHDRHGTACQEPERRLLLAYALQRLDDEQALTFEAHLLACDTCFQDLKYLDRAGRLLREFTESGGAPLERLARPGERAAAEAEILPAHGSRSPAGQG